MRDCWPTGRARALVAAKPPREADQNGRPDCAACPPHHLLVGRGCRIQGSVQPQLGAEQPIRAGACPATLSGVHTRAKSRRLQTWWSGSFTRRRAMSGGENAVAKILSEEHFTQHRLYPNYFFKGSNGSNGNEWSTTGLSGFKMVNSGHILLDPECRDFFLSWIDFPIPISDELRGPTMSPTWRTIFLLVSPPFSLPSLGRGLPSVPVRPIKSALAWTRWSRSLLVGSLWGVIAATTMT